MVMHPIRKKRLLVVLFVMVFAAIGIGLVIYALRQNMNLFYAPAGVVSGEAPLDQQIRVGGYVVKGSIQREPDGLTVRFHLTDGIADIAVRYTGILPDLFTEGQAAVAKGKLSSRQELVATEVLAKHDENYTPPEIKETAVGREMKK